MSAKKTTVIKLLGSRCKICGLPFDGENGYLFDLHHHVPNGNTSRRFNSSTELNQTKVADISAFAADKVLLCALCHRKYHHGDATYD